MAQESTGSDRLLTAGENVKDAVVALNQSLIQFSTELDNVRYVMEFMRSWETSKRRVRVTKDAYDTA